MKIHAQLFLFVVFTMSVIHANDAVDIQNITTSQILPIAKIEYTTDQLFNNKSEGKKALFPNYENQLCSNQLLPAQLIKDIHVRKTPTIDPESFVPSANHTFYDFSQMEPDRAPQNIGLNFTALNSAQSTFPIAIPPDTMLGVGPTQIMVTLNNGIVTYNKTTGLRDNIIESTLPAMANVFKFQFLGTVSSLEAGDPRIRYDRFTDRWFFVCISATFLILPEDIPVYLPNAIIIVLSDTGIITKSTKWTSYIFQQADIFPPAEPLSFADYPTLGIDANALYIGTNMYIGEAGVTASLFVFPKAGLISGAPVGTAFRGWPVCTPQGVDNFDSAPTNGFFIATPIATGLSVEPVANTLFLFIISNPGTTPFLSGVIPIVVDAWTAPPLGAPHKDNFQEPNGRVIAGDGRLYMAHIRNNQLFTTHTIGVDSTGSSLPIPPPDRTALRWYQIDVSNPLLPSVVQQGTFFDSALINPRFFYYPAIMTNVRGDMSLSCSTSAADQFIDALTMGRMAFDPPNTLRPPVFLTNTPFSYNFVTVASDILGFQRWGDYSYTALDPSDDMTMWTAQEFCAGTDNAGIRIAQLLAP